MATVDYWGVGCDLQMHYLSKA